MNTMKYIFIMFLVGCGTDDSLVPSEKASDTSAQKTNVRSTEVESENDFSQEEAFLAETKADMPECNEKIKKRLAYVVESDSFQSCNGKEWLEVKVKGKDGVNGKDGKDGVNGKDGKDGAIGATGAAGKDAKTLSATEWEHPLTGALWFVGGAYYNQQAAASCPAGSRFPLSSEWVSAYQAGITNKLGTDGYTTNQRLWIEANTYVQVYTGSTALSALGTQYARDTSSSNGALSYRTLCVKE